MRSMVRGVWIIWVSAALVLAASTQDRKFPQASPIEMSRITSHVKMPASDAFEGRGPATRAEQKTLEYLIALRVASPGIATLASNSVRRASLVGPELVFQQMVVG